MKLTKTNCIVPEDPAQSCKKALFQALQTDPRLDRNSLTYRKEKRVEHTCTWITSNHLYKSWLDSCPQLLWLSGGPGKGKTMMSIFLAEDLERFTKDSPDAVSLEFFCDNKNNKRNTADSVIQGLVFQLLHKRQELINHILPTFAIQQASLFNGSSFESLWSIFEKMTCDPMLRTIYCVLDGLDECDKDSLDVLLRHFKALFSKTFDDALSCRLNLIAVSRDHPNIIPKLLWGFPRIRLDGDADNEVNQDITRFIDAKLNDIFSAEEYPQATRERVRNIFYDRSQGTFLWIGIAAKTLEGCKAIEFEEALERLPPGLDDLYARILLGIEVGHRKIAARILRWVVMAVRPLTLSELSVIIEPAIEPPTDFTREDMTRNQVSYCGCFLTIEKCEVNLIHQSAKDYLLRGDGDNSNAELKNFRMEENAGNQEIARKCLQYLEDNLLACEDIDLMSKRSEAFPLLSYAKRYWHIHARSLPSSDDIFDLSRPFYHKDSRIRELWLNTYHHDLGKNPRESLPFHAWRRRESVPLWEDEHGTSPISSKLLHVASYFDILPLAEKLLDQEGFVKMVKRFCSIKVKRFHSINEKDSQGKTALHRAAQCGHLAIAQSLLSKGANVNAKDNKKEIPLHTAARYGHRELIRLLLENGADINAKNNEEETVLHRGAWSEHKELVRLLLEKRADINARDDFGFTVLHIASMSGNEGLARLLLEMGADINAKSDRNETALHRAPKPGNEGLVRLLLEKGSDINAKDRSNYTVLHEAARFGDEGIVRLLLHRGADVNAKTITGETALLRALVCRQWGLVQLLLDMGADVNAKDSCRETALHSAAFYGGREYGGEKIIPLLLDMGADIDAKDYRNKTALNMAADENNEGAVRLLLDRGADINVKDKDGMTALDYASKYNLKEIVELLLRTGDGSDFAARSSNEA